MLCRQTPAALTATAPLRSPVRTQLIHSRPAPSPLVAGGGARPEAGSGSAVAAWGCGAPGRSAVASSADGASETDTAGPRSSGRANLKYAYLYEANLRDTDLSETNLSRAVLKFDGFEVRGHTQEQLDGDCTSEEPAFDLPEELTWNHWPCPEPD